MAKPSPWGELRRQVRGAGWTPYEGTDPRARERLFRQRYVVVLALAVAGALLPDVDRALVVAVVLVGAAIITAAHLVARRLDRIPLWL
ncbi:MAG TPA: hypothetical protein PK748_01945, partial [Acidimicrobiales bacterium]|nr:hypothetical protein [Acidimicrobiales bacterium]